MGRSEGSGSGNTPPIESEDLALQTRFTAHTDTVNMNTWCRRGRRGRRDLRSVVCGSWSVVRGKWEWREARKAREGRDGDGFRDLPAGCLFGCLFEGVSGGCLI